MLFINVLQLNRKCGLHLTSHYSLHENVHFTRGDFSFVFFSLKINFFFLWNSLLNILIFCLVFTLKIISWARSIKLWHSWYQMIGTNWNNEQIYKIIRSSLFYSKDIDENRTDFKKKFKNYSWLRGHAKKFSFLHMIYAKLIFTQKNTNQKKKSTDILHIYGDWVNKSKSTCSEYIDFFDNL